MEYRPAVLHEDFPEYHENFRVAGTFEPVEGFQAAGTFGPAENFQAAGE